MSHKNLDRKGRWRSTIVAFRVSKEEDAAIEEAVHLAGITKQDYITRKLLNRDVVVVKSTKTYKALKDKMDEILSELKRIQSSSECTSEFLETIQYVTKIYTNTKEDS